MSEIYIVSGSTGFIGGKVVSLLSVYGKNVIGLCRNVDERKNGTISYVSNDEFLTNPEDYMKEKTIFIHLAFSRANRKSREIAGSLDFTRSILEIIGKSVNLERFIYISSQAIYGKTERIRSVANEAEPESIYAMAKYAAEKLVEMTFDEDKDYCILRMDNVIQSQNLVKALSKSAISNSCINITGGKQIFSYIDVDDAAEAIVVCACSDKRCVRHIYNVGLNQMRVSLVEVAEMIKRVAAKYSNTIEVIYKPDDITLWAGMDSEDFCKEYNWRPKYDIFSMIERVYINVLETTDKGVLRTV